MSEIAKTDWVDQPEADPIDLLRDHCIKFIQDLPGALRGHARMMALSKADEMVFWCRAQVTKAHRDV